MKVQLKRVETKHPENPLVVDGEFKHGTCFSLPFRGADFMLYLSQSHTEYIRTSEITDIKWEKAGVILFKTLNSTYHLKQGWGKRNE